MNGALKPLECFFRTLIQLKNERFNESSIESISKIALPILLAGIFYCICQTISRPYFISLHTDPSYVLDITIFIAVSSFIFSMLNTAFFVQQMAEKGETILECTLKYGCLTQNGLFDRLKNSNGTLLAQIINKEFTTINKINLCQGAIGLIAIATVLHLAYLNKGRRPLLLSAYLTSLLLLRIGLIAYDNLNKQRDFTTITNPLKECLELE